ncbi:MAG: sensor histidine kinase [Glaciihabitans sp.]|nr:sensor histidine kinase [Glaciihabitans sp.]
MSRLLRGLSISARLFFLQFAVILVLTGTATVLLWAEARADVEKDAAERCLAVAGAIAVSPFVAESVVGPEPTGQLQPYAVDIMATTDTDFVTIMAPDRTRFTHPDLGEIGKDFRGTIGPALRGESFTETYTGTLGPSVRAVVPILADGDTTPGASDGEVIGIVSVGVTVNNVSVALGSRLLIVFGAAALTLLLGGLGSWSLSRYLRRVTWGRGPVELARMFSYYQGVLHSVREGLVLVDTQGRLALYNDQAAELLRLPLARPAAPQPVAELDLPAALRSLLASGERTVDEVYLTDDRVLLVNQEVALSSDASRPARVLGTVTTLRDHTELRQLTGELQTMRTLSDALRSQTHEFSNRLHTIVALIELGRADAALEFAAHELSTSQDLADQLISSINEPALAALLLGKAAQANERGIELQFDVDQNVGHLDLVPHDVITIIGNLLDNAMDAVGRALDGHPSPSTEPPRVLLEIVREQANAADNAGPIVIRVSDNGPGVGDAERIFERGYSTKTVSPGDADQGIGRGIGLALVGQTVRRLGGQIDVESSNGAVFTVVLPAAAPV